MLSGAEHDAVARAVHGLDRVLPLLRLGEVHVVGVVVVVAGGLPEAHVQDLGRDHLVVSGLVVEVADVGDQLVVDHRALGVEEGRSRRLGMEGVEVQFAAELAVVAGLGLLQAVQVLVELLLRVEGGPVDAGEHGVLLVALPVGTRGAEQLEGLELRRARDVGAPAEVVEVALAVAADDAARGDAFDDLDLQGLAHGLEPRHGLVPAELLAMHRQALLGDPAHLGLDGGQVLHREGLLHEEVVVEPVLDHGADADPGGRMQALHRLGEEVGRGVPQQFEAVGVLAGDDGHLGPVRQGGVEVYQFSTVNPDGQGRLGEAGSDALRERGPGGPVR